MKRIILVDIADPHTHKEDALKNLSELQELVKSYGGIDVIHIIQHRTQPNTSTFIGSGKVMEVIDMVKKDRIDVIIINAIAKPTQLFNLTKAIWPVNPNIEVWDRIDLILQIFNKHASTAEAKLQIEIARMDHMGPRIYGLGGTFFSRQGGGIGGRGEGETNIELMKRHWRTLIKNKKDELARLALNRDRQRERRKEIGLKSVSIVGYTNAGKTSLFNLLTNKQKIVKDALFVTLDTATGKIYFPEKNKSIIISDTIGFIQDLPSSLIEAFKSTLSESIHADLVLHVVDILDPKMMHKIETVESILTELGIDLKKQLFVFNKVDGSIENGEMLLKRCRQDFVDFSPQFISVHEQFGIGQLMSCIQNRLFTPRL